MQVDSTQLQEFLTDAGLVSKKDFARVNERAKEEKKGVGELLVEEDLLAEQDLRKAQAQVRSIPYVDLTEERIDFDTLSLIPEPVARTHNIIAYKKHSDSLEVAMLDTEDLPAIEFIKKKVGVKILPRLTDAESIKQALLQYQKTLKDEFGDIIRKESESLKPVQTDESEGEEVSTEELKKVAEDLPVVRVVNTLLRHAIIQNASDIHIEPMENRVLVRYRIDGILRKAMTLPKNVAPSITARIKVLADLKLDEKRLPQDGRFKMELNEQKVAFRVSILPTYYGEKSVLRLLREDVAGFTLEDLGFHGDALEQVHAATRDKTGMILTTGPTGSGKTTTLYTTLDILNTPEVNISTIEDPIEYQMERINQTQVKADIGFTFARGLRALVRQDPDIIMVGEIRDKETASLAVNAALTGHLVLSTLHTNSAAGAIPRLMDMEVEPFLLVSTVNVIIAQRLVRQLTEAKEAYTLSGSELEQLKAQVDMDRVLAALREEGVVGKDDDWTDISFYKPKPSDGSADGYSGRLGIYEALPVTPSIKELIMQDATAEEIEQQARKEGMLSMLEDGLFKAAQGRTSVEEVFRVINE